MPDTCWLCGQPFTTCIGEALAMNCHHPARAVWPEWTVRVHLSCHRAYHSGQRAEDVTWDGQAVSHPYPRIHGVQALSVAEAGRVASAALWRRNGRIYLADGRENPAQSYSDGGK